MVNILLFGPQGSGKGTQAKLMVEKYHVTHISPGDLFRAEVQKGTELGHLLKDYMDKGLLVPLDINFRIVKERLEEIEKKDFILDGFPRNLEQANLLKQLVAVDLAIEIHISDDEAIKRVSARFNCPQCHAGYNTIYLKPKKDNICDNCDCSLVQRDDDKPEAVKKRLTIYHNQTEPLKAYYQKQGVFHAVNGERPIPEVFGEIQQILDGFKEK